jgi:hypothetical protein
MAMSDPRFSRRALLRGAAGAALAVPFLESWPLASRALAEPAKAPLRLLFVMVPNGVHGPTWSPKDVGADYVLPRTLEPLAPFKKDLLVVSGLAVDGARPHGDGPGDHARAGAAFLTCSHPKKTGGAEIHAGVSVDQVAAKALGQGVPFASLELGTEPSAQAGSCDSGYSCAYSSNIAWSGPASPLAKEVNPRRAFERLFLDGEGLSPAERAKRRRLRASVLDAVMGDAEKTREKLSGTDRRKLDEYLESVRTLEKRLEATARDKDRAAGHAAPPAGVPHEYAEHIRLLHDVVKLAFETNTTRVASIMIGNEGSNRSYPSIDVPDGHHDCSHHGRDAAKQAKIAKIDRFHTEQLAYLLGQLAAVKEGDGTLLDSTLVVYGSAIGDGDAHNHDQLPILLAGGAAAGIASGRHVRYPHDTPLANLYLALLDRVGVNVDSFADSTERLPGLWR